MAPIDPTQYYAECDVEHSAQGDIHRDLPFVVATVAGEEAPPRGVQASSLMRRLARQPQDRTPFNVRAVAAKPVAAL